MNNKFICMAPFSEISIDIDGNVNCCCMEYTKNYCWGNIFEQSFEEIWNGERAKEFRRDVIEGKYTYCNRNICSFGILESVEEPPSIEAPYPQFVNLAYDKTCNLMCKTCRDSIIKEDYSYEEWNEFIEKNYIPICKNAKEIFINSIGECLISKKSKILIKKLTETYPELEFNIMTNGTACNENNLTSLGLIGKLSCVQISINAATKKTYNKITRTGNFDVVMQNLRWLSEQKKKGIIPGIVMNFVVHSLNYKEMPAFVQLAKDLDLTVSFWEFQKWSDNTEMLKNYEKYTVFDRKHPEFKNLLKILKNPVFDYERCVFNNLFSNLRQEALAKKSALDSIKDFFK